MTTLAPEKDAALNELSIIAQNTPVKAVIAPVEATDVSAYLASKKPIYIDIWSDDKRDETLRAYIGGSKTGLYVRTKLPVPMEATLSDGTVERATHAEERIVPWVTVRTRAYAEVAFKDGQFEETGDASFDVLVVAPHGQRVIRKMPAADAASITRVLEAAATLGLPEPQVYHTVHVRNMLRMLGTTDCERETDAVTGGWVELPDEGAAFLEPQGTISESGVSAAYRVKVEGSDRFAGTKTISTDGADETMRAWFEVLPERLDLAVSSLGAVMASHLGLQQRTTLYIAAEPDSGKTMFLGALMGWSSEPGRRGEPSANLYADATASDVAIHDRMSIMAGVTYWDDLRFSHPKAFGFIDLISRGCYQPERRTKSAGAGKGERKQVLGATKTLSILTAEALPEAAQMGSVLSRIVIVGMRAGDLDWNNDESGSNALKRWTRIHAPRANALRGAFVQWLAKLANEAGGVEAFQQMMTERVEDTMQKLDANGVSRQAQVVSVLRTGWDMFVEFLATIGVELPVSADAVEQAWTTVLQNAWKRGAEVNPVRRMLEHVRDSIGDGYFEAADSTVPGSDVTKGFQYNAGDLGYRRDGEGRWQPKSNRAFGYVSLDGKYALITPAAIKWAKATFDPSKSLPLADPQIGAGFDRLEKDGIVLDHTFGDRPKTGMSFGFKRRPGVVVPMEWLIGEDAMSTEPDAGNAIPF